MLSQLATFTSRNIVLTGLPLEPRVRQGRLIPRNRDGGMSMKKLWAAALAGLLGCSAISWAADPVVPVPSNLPAIPTAAPASQKTDAGVVDTATQPTLPSPKETAGGTKATDSKAAPAPSQEIKMVVPVPPSCSSCSAGCGKPCGIGNRIAAVTPITCAASGCCESHSWCGLGDGHLRAWLTFRPCRTPCGECVGDYRIPHNYTFFLDIPCHESWKPVQCPDQGCGKGKCSSCCSTCGAPVPSATPMPTPVNSPAHNVIMPEKMPAPLPVGTNSGADK